MRDSRGTFIRDAKRANAQRAAGLGENEAHVPASSPAPAVSPEELARSLASDPEFEALVHAELLGPWMRAR